MGLYILFLNLGKNARAVEGGRCDCLLSRCPLPMFRQNSVYCMYMWNGCWEYPSTYMYMYNVHVLYVLLSYVWNATEVGN